jgi:hypothetical protein
MESWKKLLPETVICVSGLPVATEFGVMLKLTAGVAMVTVA